MMNVKDFHFQYSLATSFKPIGITLHLFLLRNPQLTFSHYTPILVLCVVWCGRERVKEAGSKRCVLVYSTIRN
jgi:hypothetical protein